MSKTLLGVLFVIFSFNLAYADVDFNIHERIEDMERTRAEWDKTRMQIVSSFRLSPEELLFLESLKQERKAVTTSIIKNLLHDSYEENLRMSVSDVVKIDQHYLSYLRHNLPKDIYAELASKRTAFKLSKGEKLAAALTTDFEI